MKVVALSDTHGKHHELPKGKIPDGDVLIHAGDITKLGSIPGVIDFARWFGDLPHEHKLVVAGNHDSCFEGTKKSQAVKILQEKGYTGTEE